MSYPPQRYSGDTGEVNAVFRPASTAPDLTAANGSETRYLATHHTTQGEFGLYQVDMAPRAGGPSTHFHKTISESFYVLSGTVSLFNGEEWTSATAGDFLYVPVGGLHAFRNDSNEPASMLLLFSPGAPREDYFENLAEMARRGGTEQLDFRLRHDSYFLEDM
ncbi:cupin domain-containing protein [Streptomyces oceani]|uniref:Cupin n=1 Tax=Streptomyces oceani TaxID=1075402 RepID=A0A1E7KKC4_9ACTN|nr:cupin domain-containing protein [Streptomyces oceani]OEV04336.1 cupin [Streptomyces oceani]